MLHITSPLVLFHSSFFHGFRAYVLEHNLGMEKITETKFCYLCRLTGIADLIKPRHTHRKNKKVSAEYPRIYRKPKERDQPKERIMGKEVSIWTKQAQDRSQESSFIMSAMNFPV